MTVDNAEVAAVAVAVAAAEAGPTTATATAQETLAADMSSLEIAQDSASRQPEVLPAHRSHDPQYNQKRSDPFQFGSRLLGQEDNVFEFNAWDHVETDDTYKEYAEQQYAMQRQAPVSDFDKSEWNSSVLSFFLFAGASLREAWRL